MSRKVDECKPLRRGIRPSSITYSTLIAAYGHADEETKAKNAFNEMLELRLVPDDYTFVGLMLAPAARGDVVGCLDVRRRMRSCGVSSTVHVYNELIRRGGAPKP